MSNGTVLRMETKLWLDTNLIKISIRNIALKHQIGAKNSKNDHWHQEGLGGRKVRKELRHQTFQLVKPKNL